MPKPEEQQPSPRVPGRRSQGMEAQRFSAAPAISSGAARVAHGRPIPSAAFQGTATGWKRNAPEKTREIGSVRRRRDLDLGGAVDWWGACAWQPRGHVGCYSAQASAYACAFGAIRREQQHHSSNWDWLIVSRCCRAAPPYLVHAGRDTWSPYPVLEAWNTLVPIATPRQAMYRSSGKSIYCDKHIALYMVLVFSCIVLQIRTWLEFLQISVIWNCTLFSTKGNI